jgi:hypothetical protein
MSTKDELKYDPLDYVAGMKSAVGIYLRREVFKKESKTDPALKKKLYEQTVAEQSADGSWNQLFVQTANNLWYLALGLQCKGQERRERVRVASVNPETELQRLSRLFPFQ